MWRSRPQFQLTRSRGAWPSTLPSGKRNMQFQLTRSRGAWRRNTARSMPLLQFQLTRSRGAWRWHTESTCRPYEFQLTRSRGAWRRSRPCGRKHSDFNSHAHVERDDALPDIISAIIISTHTLTWSVTHQSLSRTIAQAISTHTLTWSVTWR